MQDQEEDVPRCRKWLWTTDDAASRGNTAIILAVVFALAAAMANAINLMTQHKASIGAPRRAKGWRLALYLPRQPLWLPRRGRRSRFVRVPGAGPAQRRMSVVQPLLVTELVFVLVLCRIWIHRDVARAAWRRSASSA
jgi:hypothetical protein